MHMYSPLLAYFGQGGERPGRPGQVSFSCVGVASVDVVIEVVGSATVLVISVLGASVVAVTAVAASDDVEGVSVVCSSAPVSPCSFAIQPFGGNVVVGTGMKPTTAAVPEV